VGNKKTRNYTIAHDGLKILATFGKITNS